MPPELWDVYDRQGNLTGKTKARGVAFVDGEYYLAVGLWIVNQGGQVLIQKRTLTKKSHPGKWNITGGCALAGEDSITACIREAHEEIGFQFSPQDITLIERTFTRVAFFDDYITVCDLDISKAVLQPDEVSELRWASMDEVVDLHNAGKFMYSDVAKLEKVRGYIADTLPMNTKKGT